MKKQLTPDELYEKLDELNIAYEVVESFEGLRVINFLVDEYGDKEGQAMKYRELLEILKGMTEDELNQNVTAYLNAEDEFVPVTSVLVADDNQSVLDVGHVYFSV